MMKKKWVTLFERYEDFHYVKDVGQIPFHASKYLDYDVEVWRKGHVAHREEKEGFTLVDIPTENRGVKISFKLIFEIIRKAKKIDLLQLFHFRRYTLLYAYIYKFFNKNGMVVIKCDGTDGMMPFNVNKKIRFTVVKHVAKKIDLVSAEHLSIVRFLKKNSIPVVHVPNGVNNYFYSKTENQKLNKDKSVPTIIFIGKCGDPRKNAELAVTALSKLPEELNWKAHFLGGETQEFRKFFSEKLVTHPWLKDKIHFEGFITDPNDIIELYKISHIFLMTSEFEGYPISLAEACWMGCFPLLSRGSGGKDLVESSAGYIFDDTDDLQKKLEETISDIESTIFHGDLCRIYVYQHNDWRKNIKKLGGLVINE